MQSSQTSPQLLWRPKPAFVLLPPLSTPEPSRFLISAFPVICCDTTRLNDFRPRCQLRILSCGYKSSEREGSVQCDNRSNHETLTCLRLLFGLGLRSQGAATVLGKPTNGAKV